MKTQKGWLLMGKEREVSAPEAALSLAQTIPPAVHPALHPQGEVVATEGQVLHGPHFLPA